MYNQPFNYNPYMQPQYNRMPQPMPIPNENLTSPVASGQRPAMSGLNGKMVESIDVVKAMDIPMDGTISYFPIADGSAIVTKQLQMDGTSKMLVYQPIERKNEEIRFITKEDLEKEINKIDLSEIEDLKEELKELRLEIKDMKKKKKGDE